MDSLPFSARLVLSKTSKNINSQKRITFHTITEAMSAILSDKSAWCMAQVSRMVEEGSDSRLKTSSREQLPLLLPHS